MSWREIILKLIRHASSCKHMESERRGDRRPLNTILDLLRLEPVSRYDIQASPHLRSVKATVSAGKPALRHSQDFCKRCNINQKVECESWRMTINWHKEFVII